MKANTLVVTPNRDIKKAKLNIVANCLVSDDGQKGWFYNLPDYLSRIKELKNKMSLVLDDRVALPLNPYTDYPDDKLEKLTKMEEAGGLVDQAIIATIARANKQGTIRVIAWTVSIVVMSMALMMLIFAIMVAADKC